MDFAVARRMMVDGQVLTRDVFDPDLLAAMLEVPRERFVPPAQAALAYLDRNLPLTADGSRCLLQPMVLARLLQAADITATDHVLDVGCGTGYSSALLARLAGSVVALEEDKDLATFARRVLRELAPQVEVVEGLLKTGWPAAGPYDVIVLNGAAEIIPEPLFAQLKDGGRLVGIEGEGAGHPGANLLLDPRRNQRPVDYGGCRAALTRVRAAARVRFLRHIRGFYVAPIGQVWPAGPTSELSMPPNGRQGSQSSFRADMFRRGIGDCVAATRKGAPNTRPFEGGGG